MIGDHAKRMMVLSRIRAAVEGPSESVVVARSMPEGPAGAPHRDHLAQFVKAAEDAQTQVSIVDSFAEVGSTLDRILTAEQARLVLLSPGARMAPWDEAVQVTYQQAQLITRSPSINSLHDHLLPADVGVTVASYGLADTGTLVLCPAEDEHRLDSLVPPVHVALLQASRLLADLCSFFALASRDRLFSTHSGVVFVRGPSRTADIELVLTVGVHGPARLYTIVVNDAPA